MYAFFSFFLWCVIFVSITYTAAQMGQISLVEKLTHAHIRDCLEDQHQTLTFIVEQGDLGLVLGKGASILHRLQELFKRKIRFIEYHPDLLLFVRNAIAPLRIHEVRLATENDLQRGLLGKQATVADLSQGICLLVDSDTKVKSLLIGRNAQNLRNTEAIVQRYFKIKELRVV